MKIQFHQSFRESFKTSFLTACLKKAGNRSGAQAYCNCAEGETAKRFTDAQLIGLSNPTNEEKVVMTSIAWRCSQQVRGARR